MLLKIAACLPIIACQQTATEGFVPIVVPPLVFERTDHWSVAPNFGLAVGDTRLIVTNFLEDTVSLFDPAAIGTPAFRELGRVPVGLSPIQTEGAHHAAVDPGGEFYYVGVSNNVPAGGSGPHGAHGTGSGPGYIVKYRTSDNRLEASVRVDPSPGDLLVSSDGKTLYVTHFDLLQISEGARNGTPPGEIRSRLIRIDTATMTRTAAVPLCAAAHGMRFAPDERTLYVACYSDQLAVVDVSETTLPVTLLRVAENAGDAFSPLHEPYAVTVSPANGDVWVSSIGSRELQLFDPAARAMVASRRVLLPGPPIFGSFTADGRLLYMAVQGVDQAVAMIAATGEIAARYSLRAHGCVSAHEILLIDRDRKALVVCEGDHIEAGSLLVLDLERDGELMHSISVGIFPDYVGVVRRTR